MFTEFKIPKCELLLSYFLINNSNKEKFQLTIYSCSNISINPTRETETNLEVGKRTKTRQ